MLKINEVNESVVFEYEIKRENKRPLKFKGYDAVIKLDTHSEISFGDKYYSGFNHATHSIDVIRTTGNNCVIRLRYTTWMQGDTQHYDAVLCKTIEDAEKALSSFSGKIPWRCQEEVLSNLKIIGKKYNWFELIP